MALTIHGSARSRTMRVLWMAAELGLDFEHDPIAFDDPGLKSPAFLQLNPAGAIPTLEDDGFALAESLAINLYLAKKHSLGGLYPATLRGEAQAWRWSLWAQGQLEPWIMRDALLAELHAAAAPHAAPGDRRGPGHAGARVARSRVAAGRRLHRRRPQRGRGPLAVPFEPIGPDALSPRLRTGSPAATPDRLPWRRGRGTPRSTTVMVVRTYRLTVDHEEKRRDDREASCTCSLR